ncbi:putative leucine-rich repeat-containing protein DDB_G0281931 [Oscarella lobularis]|uniref:putative leucine-rich repeat-containing protein DDB_G0281931 n=1 Tax=Oscarella lobularis TaxID=121494 RepID=UPI0033140865
MLDIVFVSFANNDLNGDIPLAFSLVASAARFDVRGNEQLQASNISNPLPTFLEPKSNFWFKERSTDPYSCQQINFKRYNRGVFLLDSSYYYRIFCNCSQGFYGHSGNCFLCPKDATCNESLQNSSIQFGKDLYPFTTGRTVALYDCKQNAFVHKNRCNPSGNCKCWLSQNASNITCNQTCLCATNTGGRLCSECAPSTHVSLLGDCVPCAAVNASLPKVYIVIGCLVLFLFVLWIVKQVRPCGISSKHLNRIRIFMIGVEIVVIVTLAATETIPLFVAEAYFLILFLVIFSQLKLTALKITFTTIIVFLQIIGTIQSTPLKRNCKFCTFKQLFSLIGLDRVVKVVNFHFGEIACVFPIAYKPLGKLALLGVFPLVLGLLIVLKIAVDYYSHKCQKLSPKEAKKLKKKSLKQAKCNVMLILIVMYFPIVSNALKVAMPCEHELGNRAMKYMKAYPFIECNSSEHWILVVIAATELAVYGCLIPLVFYVLLQLYGPSRNQNRLNDKDFLSRSDARKGAKWLRCLHSPYQRAYRKYMGIIFILRRLLVAVVLRVFAGQDGDVEQLVFTALCVVFIAFSIGVRPYKNATRYNLENYADATGFAVILLTYHMETTNASPTTAILVFIINICYVAGLVTLGIYQLCKARKTCKKPKTLCRLS